MLLTDVGVIVQVIEGVIMLLYARVCKFEKISQFNVSINSEPHTAPTPVSLILMINQVVKEHFTKSELKAIANAFKNRGHLVTLSDTDYLNGLGVRLLFVNDANGSICCLVMNLDFAIIDQIRIVL